MLQLEYWTPQDKEMSRVMPLFACRADFHLNSWILDSLFPVTLHNPSEWTAAKCISSFAFVVVGYSIRSWIWICYFSLRFIFLSFSFFFFFLHVLGSDVKKQLLSLLSTDPKWLLLNGHWSELSADPLKSTMSRWQQAAFNPERILFSALTVC